MLVHEKQPAGDVAIEPIQGLKPDSGSFTGWFLGCCWETFCIVASCGLVVEIQIHLTAKI